MKTSAKKRLARRLLTPLERASGVSIFNSSAWNLRKERRQDKVKKAQGVKKPKGKK